MGYGATAADDYKVVDNTETVSYWVAGSQVPIEVKFADPHDYTREEAAASNGLVSYGDRQWGLGCNQFPDGFKPVPGDRIVQAARTGQLAGDVWVVFGHATRDALGVSWFVDTRGAR